MHKRPLALLIWQDTVNVCRYPSFFCLFCPFSILKCSFANKNHKKLQAFVSSVLFGFFFNFQLPYIFCLSWSTASAGHDILLCSQILSLSLLDLTFHHISLPACILLHSLSTLLFKGLCLPSGPLSMAITLAASPSLRTPNCPLVCLMFGVLAYRFQDTLLPACIAAFLWSRDFIGWREVQESVATQITPMTALQRSWTQARVCAS